MFDKLCGAKARTNDHKPCRQPAMANGRCRFHGGKSTGAKTQHGKAAQRNARLTHGKYSAGLHAGQKTLRALLSQSDCLLSQIRKSQAHCD